MDRRASIALLSVASLALACRRAQPTPTHADEDGWSVTAWGERYEVFAETDGLAVGETATSNAHVTVLSGFSALRAGTVTLVLKPASGPEQVFMTDTPKREGIFPVQVKPTAQGQFELLFRIESAAGREELAAGQVQVGAAGRPGGLVADAPEAAPEGVSFLKEQQWRTPFATAWAVEGDLRDSVSGAARVRPVAGGEAVLTAPVDATVGAEPWPYVGLDAQRGRTLFRLVPRVSDRSLPEVQADADGLAAEAHAARQRLERLEQLLKVEASSPAEIERARAALVGLEARLIAARQGLHASGAGAGAPSSLDVVAPWAGRVAEITVTPGQTVSAGAALARIVRVRPLWLEVALRPEDARRLQGERLDIAIRRAGTAEPLRLRAARLVSRAPEIDPRTATLAVLVEADLAASELPIGSSVEADLTLPSARKGILVPVSSLVQDAGTTVVYVQLGGEAFARREVRVLARQVDGALVVGVRLHERVVSVGGGAVRRASLLSAGAPEGHVH